MNMGILAKAGRWPGMAGADIYRAGNNSTLCQTHATRLPGAAPAVSHASRLVKRPQQAIFTESSRIH